mmetsp:Transcript_12044/g.11918  ORF Transcript_12044/g.11918 Transcript_12044/m.11918 type:complete len:149 (+) Transcript_12044:178-624(+)
MEESQNGELPLNKENMFNISLTDSKAFTCNISSLENLVHPKQEGLRVSNESKALQLPMRLSDKFFDEDPGLIKIVDNDSGLDMTFPFNQEQMVAQLELMERTQDSQGDDLQQILNDPSQRALIEQAMRTRLQQLREQTLLYENMLSQT